MEQIRSGKKKYDAKRLEEIENEQKRHVEEVLGQIHEMKKAIDQKRLDEIEKAQVEHMREVLMEIEEHKRTQDLEKLDEVEQKQKVHHDEVCRQIEAHRKAMDQERLVELERRQHQNAELVLQQISHLRESSRARDEEVIESPKKANEDFNHEGTDEQVDEISITVTPVRGARMSDAYNTFTLGSGSSKKGNLNSDERSPFGSSNRRSRKKRLEGREDKTPSNKSKESNVEEEEKKIPASIRESITKKSIDKKQKVPKVVKKLGSARAGGPKLSKPVYTGVMFTV